MMDTYFKNPVKWDFLISTIAVILSRVLIWEKIIVVPSEGSIYSMLTNISATALTMVGFILTLLTVLISFKSTNRVNRENEIDTETAFDLFFASRLYFRTTDILKNAIKSLTLVSLSGYLLGLFSKDIPYSPLFYYCVFGIIVILLTVWRSIVILDKIIKMQDGGDDEGTDD